MSKNRPFKSFLLSSAVPRSLSFTSEIVPLYHSPVAPGELAKCFSKDVPTKGLPLDKTAWLPQHALAPLLRRL